MLGLRRAQRKDGADGPAERLVTISSPDSLASESFRALRANLLFSPVDNPPKVIMVTSPGPGEGKSTSCANLGIVLSQAGTETLVIDCDLRRPVLHKLFQLRNLEGVTSVLANQRSLQEVWHEPLEGLKVVTAGPIPPNPAEVVGSQLFAKLLAEARKSFDYVLIDSSPVQLVSDPVVLATRVDGTLLVIDAQKTRKGAVRQSMRSLEAVGAHVVGTIVNNARVPKERPLYYDHAQGMY